jgi:hypothetical protein
MTESSRAINFIPARRRGGQSGAPCSLGIRLGPIAVLSLTILALTKVDAARAATIRDGEAFSISIENPNARVCIIFPESARDPAACAGLTLSAQPPTTSGRRDLAIGLIRFVDQGAAARASLAVTFIPESDSVYPDNAYAQALAREVERAYTRDHPGTNVRGGTSLVEMRDVAGLNVVRGVFDVDGLNSDDRLRMEHHIYYFTWAEAGTYSFMLSTGGDHAAAVDAIADSSALTLRVSHPAQPSLLSQERRPLVAVLVWFIFAVGTVINLLWAYLNRERRFTPPTSLASLPALALFLNAGEFDVSAPARLRKPIRSAARALKMIGLFSAFTVAGYLDHYLGFVADLACAVVVVWCAFRVSKRLRSGSVLCAGLACAWCVAWAGIEAFDHLPKALRVNQDFYSVFYTAVGASLFVIPLGFLARGLLAFRALRAYQKSARNAGDPLAHHPWEEGLYIRKHPRFVNKRSISGHFFVLLAPLPYLWVWATGKVSDSGDVPYLIGRYTAVTCIALGTLAWGTLIYRRARKEAMLPGSELVKEDSRPIVLYLRSFHDDKKIKLRARATDGRILLERLVKISFEELVTDHLWGYGPVLAIGDPGTRGRPAPLGAARHFVTDASWQEAATHLMRQASMIVAIAAATPGLAWEIGTVVERGFMAKLALLLPPLESGELEARWQFLLSSALGASLPSQIDLSRARALVFPGGHPVLITGNKRNEWTYEAVLDEAALLITNQPSPSPVEPLAALETKQHLAGGR